jgi:hypothetical protein
LRTTPTWNQPNRHLWVAEDRFANGRKTHIRSQRDLTPSAAGASLDFCNDRLGHIPESLADRLRKTKTARMGYGLGGISNPAQAGMGYEEVRKRALQDHDPDAPISFEFPAELVELLR